MNKPPERTHALLSPSASGRWLNCTACIRLTEHIEDEPSTYADEGTTAHTVADIVARKMFKLSTPELIASSEASAKELPFYDENMQGYAAQFANLLLELVYRQGENAQLILEEKLDISDWAPECFGYADAAVLSPTEINVIDYKYGKGVVVSAENNTQMILYALGVLKIWLAHRDWVRFMYGASEWPEMPQTVGLHICQPRISQENSSHYMTFEQLLQWGEHIKPLAVKAFNGAGEPNPGPWCKDYFCPLRVTCRYRARTILSDLFSDMLMKDAAELTPEEIGTVLHLTKDFVGWRNSLETHVKKEIKKGNTVPGWKLAEGAKIRSWKPDTDFEVLETVLKEAGLRTKSFKETVYKSPPQIEGMLRGTGYYEQVEQLFVETNRKAPSLVPDTSPKKEFNEVANDYKDLVGGV